MKASHAAGVGLPVIALLWAGLVLGISFLEAPVKFQAPTLTREVGLDVGRHVFAASHLVQLCLGALALAAALAARVSRRIWVLVAIAAVALLAQHLVLMPELEERARLVIAGGAPAGSSPHAPYVALEVLKVACLIYAAVRAGLDGRSSGPM